MGTGEMKAGFLWFWIFIIAAAFASDFLVVDLDEVRQARKQNFSIASCNFTLNILKHIDKNKGSNIAFSPVSIGILLAVLQQGARGNTSEELDKVLQLRARETREGFSKLPLFEEQEKVKLKCGTQCFLRTGTQLQREFHEKVKDKFRLSVVEMDFANLPQDVIVTKINDWIRLNTGGKIKNLVDPSMVSPDTVMLLINEIFFKGTWLRPFKIKQSKVKSFQTSEKNSVETVFMNLREKFYSDRDSLLGAKWLQIPYENERFSMVFILPTKKHRLSRLIAKLSGEELQEIFTSRAVSNVRVHIPKFKLSQKYSLVEMLQELGVNAIFSEESDLRGMVAKNLQVSDMIHQANIEINEEGSTSTAATVVQYLRSRPPTTTFLANEPFLFFVVDVQNNIPLFAGRVSNPAV